MEARDKARQHVSAQLAGTEEARAAQGRVDMPRTDQDDDSVVMTAAGVPASFFPDIVYDQDGKPRPRRLVYDEGNSDALADVIDLGDVTGDGPQDDPTYRPLG